MSWAKRPRSARRGCPRVLHVAASFWPDSGGIARNVQILVRARPAGSSMVVVPSHDSLCHFERVGGIPVLRVPRQGVVHSAPTGAITLGLGLRLRRLLAGYDLLHAHLPFPMLVAQSLLLPATPPLVITFHNEIQDDVAIPRPIMAGHAWLQRRLLARARAIIVGTLDYGYACPSLAGLGTALREIPYSIDADALSTTLPPPASRAGTQLLYVGRLAYYKGLHVLLAALALLQDVQLVVVGDGPEREQLHRQAADLRLGSRVTWCGHLPDLDLFALYRTATALVLPSTGMSESYGMVQLEAHACGMPVVSSALPGLRVVNRDGVTGLLTRPGDVEDLAAVLRRLLADAALRARLGEAAWRIVRSDYNLTTMVERVERVYAEALERSPHITA